MSSIKARFAVVSLVLAVVGGTLSQPMALAAPSQVNSDRAAQGSSTNARGEFKVRGLKWKACRDDRSIQCASMRVPKSWKNPKSGTKNTVVLDLRRLPTTSRASKRPTLFMNPGGPGGSGTQTLTRLAPKFSPLRSSYNIVSWDPRGVPTSSPLPRDCPTFPMSMSPKFGKFSWSTSTKRNYSKVKQQLSHCIKVNKSLSRWVGTNDVVQDLDAMRKAVGDKKLSYLGFSYGTTIGRTYQLTYPNRVRVMLLDGVTGPAAAGSQNAQIRLEGASRGWKMVYNRLAPGVKRVYRGVEKHLQSQVISEAGKTMNRWEFWLSAINSLRNTAAQQSLPVLICSLGQDIDLTDPACNRITNRSSMSTASAIREVKRRARIDLASPILQLVNCGEQRSYLNSSQSASWVTKTARHGGAPPALSQITFANLCAGTSKGWNVLPGLTKKTKLPKPPLIVNGIGDMATPYGGAVNTYKLLPKSRIITVNTAIHGISLIMGSRCVNNVAIRYLKSTKLPKNNVRCRQYLS